MNLFNDLDKNIFREILNKYDYRIKAYKKGTTIYFEGDLCKNYDIIIEGTLSIQNIDNDGNLHTLCNFKRGDVLGEVLIFSSENFYPMNVICLEDSKILHLEKDLVIKICQENIEFLQILLFKISNKALELKNKVKILTSKSLRDKIINFLLTQEKIQKSKTIKLKITKTDLASYFSVQRTSLSRELKKMKDENLIDYNSKTVTIINL